MFKGELVGRDCDGLCSVVERWGHHRLQLKSIVITRPCLARLKHEKGAFYSVNLSITLCRDVVRPFLAESGNLPGSDQDRAFSKAASW